MITSKQRSALRAMANDMQPIFQLGKGGITENFIKQVDEALEARELIKITILRNSDSDARSACDELCAALGAEPVQSIGNKFVLYRVSTKNPVIEL